MTLVLTFLIFIGAIALLAIGVMLSRRPIKSGCCGAAKVSNECKPDHKPKEEA